MSVSIFEIRYVNSRRIECLYLKDIDQIFINMVTYYVIENCSMIEEECYGCKAKGKFRVWSKDRGGYFIDCSECNRWFADIK